MKAGDTVRPVVSLVGLDSRRQYRVAHVEEAPLGQSIAYLVDPLGALLPPIENAHLVLEVVRAPATLKPSLALFN